MEDADQLLLALLRIALIPFVSYAVVRFARRWPWVALALLLALIAVGARVFGYAAYDGYSVRLDPRKMYFGSEIGRWCFAVGGVSVILGIPALPLVVIARARIGAVTGPAGGQWLAVLFGYFLASAIFGMVLYSWHTIIVR